MGTTIEADILDIVRRMRRNVTEMDNCYWLAEKAKSLNDPLLNGLIDTTITKINTASISMAALLKHVESNRVYKDIVKKYRAPSAPNDD